MKNKRIQVYYQINNSYTHKKQFYFENVLITGTSSGIGKETALHFALIGILWSVLGYQLFNGLIRRFVLK